MGKAIAVSVQASDSVGKIDALPGTTFFVVAIIVRTLDTVIADRIFQDPP